MLSKGGPDGGFALQPNAEGTFGLANFSDKTGIPKMMQYIGTTYHTTYGPLHYNDTINMNIFPDCEYEGNAVLTLFSISQIPGAFGDAGQNYKNIAQILKALPKGSVIENSTQWGCGKQQPTGMPNCAKPK